MPVGMVKRGMYTFLRALSSFLFLLSALLPDAPARADGPSVSIDLATLSTQNGTLLRVYGHTGTGNRGVPVAGGFDCDGDTLLDYAMASMQASPRGRSITCIPALHLR